MGFLSLRWTCDVVDGCAAVTALRCDPRVHALTPRAAGRLTYMGVL